MKIAQPAFRWLLIGCAAMTCTGCVTETFPDEDPPTPTRWPSQKHGFFDFLHFGKHSQNKTRTEIAPPFPPDQAPVQTFQPMQTVTPVQPAQPPQEARL